MFEVKPGTKPRTIEEDSYGKDIAQSRFPRNHQGAPRSAPLDCGPEYLIPAIPEKGGGFAMLRQRIQQMNLDRAIIGRYRTHNACVDHPLGDNDIRSPVHWLVADN